MRAVVVTGGSITEYSFLKKIFLPDDFIICADGGINHLIKLKIKPHVFVGDFDSCDFDAIKSMKLLAETEIKSYPARKNVTDTHIAVSEAIARGFVQIMIIGGTGCRLDHTMANVFLLKYIKQRGADGVIMDEKNEIRIIDRPAVIRPRQGRHLSLLPLTPEVSGVTLKGMEYPLENFCLKMGDTIGISNNFTSRDAEIFFDSGMLLLIMSCD